MSDNGWIKLHRKLVGNPIMQRPNYLALWILLLLKANHKGEKLLWDGGILDIKEGQFVTGRKRLSEESGIPEGTVEDILRVLETQHQIQQQKNNKFRLITIVNWASYQQDSDSKSNNKATTKQQPADTNKNDKKEKKKTLAPPEGVEKPKFTQLGAEVLKAFESVDPKNKTYYANTTQRKACDFLIEEYGLEKTLQAINILPRINQQKLYIRQITTPHELKENWTKIGNAIRQNSGFKKNNVAFS